MKRIIILFAFMAIGSGLAFSQVTFSITKVNQGAVPSGVVNEFNKDFPGAKVTRWEKHVSEGKNVYTRYVAVFPVSGVATRARYTDDGKGISSTTYYWLLNAAKLPQPLKDYAANKYPDHKLSGGEKIRSLRNDMYVYRIRLRKGASLVVVYLNDKGEELAKGGIPTELTEDEAVEEEGK